MEHASKITFECFVLSTILFQFIDFSSVIKHTFNLLFGSSHQMIYLMSKQLLFASFEWGEWPIHIDRPLWAVMVTIKTLCESILTYFTLEWLFLLLWSQKYHFEWNSLSITIKWFVSSDIKTSRFIAQPK